MSHHGVFYTDSFFDFILIFVLIVPWQDKGDLRRILLWLCLHIKWFVWGRLVFNLIYANVFFRTLIARITRILQVRGTCFIKGKIFDSLNHGEADNSSFFILHSSFFILHSSFFIFQAAASGHACKSVYNPFASKGKVKKDPWSKTPCASDKSVSAFLTFVLWP